jgi:ureidoacrylate peracid hydrolase
MNDPLSATTADRLGVLRDWLDPARTALVIIDMQEEFTHPESCVARWFAEQTGRDLSTFPPYDPAAPSVPGDPNLDEIPRLRALISDLRRLSVPVIWVPTRITPENDGRFWKTVGLRNCFEGEWTEQISAGLDPLPNETFVYKTRHSGFFQTELEDVLRARGVETVIVAGRATSGCVEATCREGMARDFGIVLAADCCGPPGPTHDADVAKIARFFGFAATSHEIVELLS